MLPQQAGLLYLCGGEIRRYNEELMSYQTLIPREAGFDFLDQPDGTEAELTLISTLDIVGEDLFFTVEQSAQSGENFGWRPVYNRERSTFYTMKIGEAQRQNCTRIDRRIGPAQIRIWP